LVENLGFNILYWS